jgi:predicted phage terminase large subunit-like protein
VGNAPDLSFLARPGALFELRRERAERSLHAFLRDFAWRVLWPATPFKDNWHIHEIAEHCQAVSRGQIRRLCINMPFRMLKSTIVSQSFPAWDWIDHPSRQFLTASYAQDVATRDAVDSRRIIASPAYQTAWSGRFKLTTDQNVKTRYENDQRGARTITSTDGAGTGFGGDIRIIDDPVSAKDADSALALATSIEWWKGTMATRANDPNTGAVIVVHQRLNPNDLTGYLLAEEKGWEHLVLPFRYDPALRKTTSLGFQDPRKTEGELIQPERVDETTAQELEKSLGTYHVHAQLQQNPEPRGGIIFDRSKWRYWRALPNLDEIVLSVDCTFKDLQSSDFVAIQAWGFKGADNFLLKRTKARMGFKATVEAVRSMRALFPHCVAVLIEDKANGSAVIETLHSEINGVIAITPDGGKVARAYAMQPTQEAGNVLLPDPSVDPDIETFLSEVSSFPAAPHDDEVDSMSQAINWRRKRLSGPGMAVFDFLKAGHDEQMQQRAAKLKEAA